MGAERKKRVFSSFKDLKKTVFPKSNPGNRTNNRETCPCCGNRARYPGHWLCSRCNKEYIEETSRIAEAVLEAEEGSEEASQPIPTREEWVMEKGKSTLERLRSELLPAKEQEREEQKPYWKQAHQEINDELAARGQKNRIDTQVFNRLKGRRFTKIWGNDPKHVALSRKVNGLSKGVESLENFLKEKLEESEE